MTDTLLRNRDGENPCREDGGGGCRSAWWWQLGSLTTVGWRVAAAAVALMTHLKGENGT